MLGWSEEQLFNSSLKHIMKQIDIYMKINNPDSNGTDNKFENNRTSTKQNENVHVFSVLD